MPSPVARQGVALERPGKRQIRRRTEDTEGEEGKAADRLERVCRGGGLDADDADRRDRRGDDSAVARRGGAEATCKRRGTDKTDDACAEDQALRYDDGAGPGKGADADIEPKLCRKEDVGEER